MASLRELCEVHTTLVPEDVQQIEELAQYLQLFADISQSDMFIDCPAVGENEALVAAQAHPTTAKSLYKTSVVGQMALAENEPAVLSSLLTGEPVIGSRGISQEQIVMRQNVMPIKNACGVTIGTLIMERDISAEVEQEKNVELLMETTEQLSETLLKLAKESKFLSLIHEGMILFDYRRVITYVNTRACQLLRAIGHEAPLEGKPLAQCFADMFAKERFQQSGGVVFAEFQSGNLCLQLKAVSIVRDETEVGGILLLRDISEIKEKEKQLMIKSAVIKEIHHRVKNNLQTIGSLLRLQMRRSASPELKRVYRESINRIISIATVHEFLAQNGQEQVDFREVADKLAKAIVSSMAAYGKRMEVRVTGEKQYLAADRATALALILGELLQTSVIHGAAGSQDGTITVGLRQKGAFAQLTLSGGGMVVSDPTVPHDQLGLQIVQTLIAEDLGGKLTFTRTGQGTAMTITYPVRKGDSEE
ncbi:sensor histidine kinase [Brevibacillus marinus]|uniref:sensor histidine kinase n=1 Tax=Brevibacillus marinus TaxID=2496837 RepID=UPI000F82EF11|nr:histidine kinase N-terminal domain-containing protein [Brevibacillus marinus]